MNRLPALAVLPRLRSGFFALIGGVSTFGAIGLLVGPLLVALFLAIVRMYHRDYTPDDPRVPEVPGLPAGPPR